MREGFSASIAEARAAGTRPPAIALIVADTNPASLSYVGLKHKIATQCGFDARKIELGEGATKELLRSTLRSLAADLDIDGILLQLPLPAGWDEQEFLEMIPVAKDIDGLTLANLGLLLLGRPAHPPCTPAGIMKLLESTGVTLAGKRVAVVGQGPLVGGPTAILLRQARATVINIRRSDPNPRELTRQCDILVVGTGQAGLVDASWVKPGAIVIDAGNNRTAEGKMVGDVQFDAVAPVASWITPVPGGVGPMTIACLLENALRAWSRQVAPTASK
jgi:methylenetetrahydrofolate dehydrogenase (NADP+)/methenyltetrahydrofolate cyclohydrolase